MAELVDAHVSGACASDGMRVRVSLPAHEAIRKGCLFLLVSTPERSRSHFWVLLRIKDGADGRKNSARFMLIAVKRSFQLLICHVLYDPGKNCRVLYS